MNSQRAHSHPVKGSGRLVCAARGRRVKSNVGVVAVRVVELAVQVRIVTTFYIGQYNVIVIASVFLGGFVAKWFSIRN